MKLQYCSDLHLEFNENRDFIKKNPIIPTADILLLAGDIMPFTAMDRHRDFFDFVSDNFEMTYWIPGNHEYYHSNLADFDSLHENLRKNVLLVNNYMAVHGNVKLILSTLWSIIAPENENKIASRMNDFRLIEYNDRLLKPSDVSVLHRTSKCFIQLASNDSSTAKKIVITHHVPTFRNYPAKYKGDLLNEAFAVELSEFIENSEIDYWIYGHHHCNTQEFSIGRTKLVTNQLGYVHRDEHLGYGSDRVIEIP